METERLIVLGFVAFFTSILSGIGGAGGGFIGTPLLIFLGLTPQQAVASGKIGGLGVTLGSLRGLTKAKVHSWSVILPLMVLATIVGLIAPRIITSIDNDTYRRVIGVLLLALIPLVLYKRTGMQKTEVAQWQRIAAVPLLVITMLMQAVLSGGMGTLVVLVLMGFMGMGALEANVNKRFSQIILNVLVVLGLLGSGLIVWSVALTLFCVNTVGGYIGSQIAVKKGDTFIAYVFAFLMFVSSLELLFG